MQLGMVGLGRMGANMTERLSAAGHDVKTFDPNVEATRVVARGARAAARRAALGLADGAGRHRRLASSSELAPHLAEGDTIIDGGNSYYVDDLRRSGELQRQGHPLRRRRRQRRRLGHASAATA